MRISYPLAFMLYAAAEAAVLLWIWSSFGAVALVGVLVAGFLLGVLVMRIAGLSAVSALANPQQRAEAFGMTSQDGTEQIVHGARPTGEQVEESVRRAATDVGRSSLLFVAGGLLAWPGVISGAAGLVLLLPQVRDRIARRMARSLVLQPPGATRITVVTVDEDGASATQWTSGHEQQQQRPPVIRGEVLPPPRQAPDEDGQ